MTSNASVIGVTAIVFVIMLLALYMSGYERD